ncbi:hypothetical protein [Calothrix sp. NIES-3974]|uniref:hypothetical protein n=1 Tax=Calothrix sp. NIES-3974 TaxID=2005462 RepID=UPI000B620176|nr:hypothetical protein [Calothrix sp. NIES-3974]BAZ07295.1 hypothetical protein NIES3974_39580 [Calothrix sp. NIES-3974]
MQLHSINQVHQSPSPEKSGCVSPIPNNEQLLVLAQIFSRKLAGEITDSQKIQVRCAISHQRVMVLIEHPEEIAIAPDTIVVLLAQTMESHPEYITHKVEFFFRKLGVKRPYAKRIVTFKIRHTHSTNSAVTPEHSSALTLRKSSSLITLQSITKSIPPLRMQAEMETNTDIQSSPWSKSSGLSNIFLGWLIAGITGTCGATYVLTRPCVLGECQALQAARKLDLDLKQLGENANNERDLKQLQTRIEETKINLKAIPRWSSRSAEVASLTAKLSTESQAVTHMIMGWEKGVTAIQQTRSFTDNINDLYTRQQLWRNAIAPLEAIRPHSAFYQIAQTRLSLYRNGLQSVNVQLLAQGRWQQRLNAAKAIATTASQRDTTAKTLREFQQAQNTWQTVINALQNIPQTSPVYLQAQQLLKVYQPKLIAAQTRVRNEQNSGLLYNQARNTAQQAQTAMQNSQWQQAVSLWQQALNLARQVAPGTSHYSQAQPLVDLYTSALEQARTQIINPDEIEIARRDLEKTCQGTTRICNFSLANRAITVRMTPDYEKTLEASLQPVAGKTENVTLVTNHLQTLQTALEAISDNADLPLFVFDAQGAQIYTHIPRSKAN